MTSPSHRLHRLRLPEEKALLLRFHDLNDRENGFERTNADRDVLLRALVDHGDLYHCLVLFRGEEPVGYMRGYNRISTSSCDMVFMLDIVYVAPSHRGQGAGKQMIGSLIDYAKSIGSVRIDLLVDIGNEVAKRLYTSFGFRGRTRFQMHRFMKEDEDLTSYFEKKVAREGEPGDE